MDKIKIIIGTSILLLVSVQANAALITRSVEVDLINDGRVFAFPDKDSWEGITSVDNFTVQMGDVLKLEIRFADNKALQLSDLPEGVDFELTKLTLFADSSHFIYGAITKYDYQGVVGDFNEDNLGKNDIGNAGGGLSFKVFFHNDNLTDSSFQYSGIDFYIDFSTFLLDSGSGIFNALEWSSSADDVQIVSVPAPVTIDIKLGSDPNGINPRSEGVVPVAVLGSMVFDAMQIDFSTVTLGPGGASPTHDGHVEDVNDDGFVDMVFHFNTQETGIACGDPDATLTGETTGGTQFIGTDTVKTVGCNGTKQDTSISTKGAGAMSWIFLVGLGVLGLWRQKG